MHFSHSGEIWRDFPELVPGALFVSGITKDALPDISPYNAIARTRLAGATESELPEIQAWRRTYSKLGLKPTQYRCASEALLRRFRKEGELPSIHPLIDLCNAVSLAYAIPIAALDLSEISGNLVVRPAVGDESYETFGGDIEHPDPGEVIFADDARQAHARRWTNRQSGSSAVRDTTGRVLIVAEALHATAAHDIAQLVASLSKELAAAWPVTPRTAILSATEPTFTVT